MKKLLCTAISAIILLSSAFMSHAELLPLTEFKGDSAANVTAEEIKEAIRSASLEKYPNNEVFLNAKTEDGRMFKDIVDTSLTIKDEKRGYVIFTGKAKDGALYTVFYSDDDEEADVYEVTEGALLDCILFDYDRAAEIINNAGLGKPISMEREAFGTSITTASGKYFYTERACTDNYGKKIGADYYELSADKVYRYEDYELWLNTKKKNMEKRQENVADNTVITIDENDDVIEVTPKPKSTAKPTDEPKSTAKPTDEPKTTAEPTEVPKSTDAPEETTAPSASPAPETLTVFGGEELTIIIGGKTVAFPDAKPFIDENNRTQVPIRAVAEMLSCDVDWDGEAKTAVIEKTDGTKIIITVGSDILNVNGSETKMDTTAAIANDRTYIPVRFVAEAMGLTVEWK